MAMVKFATVCDKPNCKNRSEEYTGYPTCRDCQEEVCPAHMVPGSLNSFDGTNGYTCLCVECGKAEEVAQ